MHNLWIFQGQVPGSLQDDRAAFVLDVGDRPAVHILGQLLVGMGTSAIGHFRDIAGDSNEGRFWPRSGHSCAGPRKARLWVHGLISQTVLLLLPRALPTAG